MYFICRYIFSKIKTQFQKFNKSVFSPKKRVQHVREEKLLYGRLSAKEKGDNFEKFVLKLFDFKTERFVLKEWRSDKIFDGIYPKSNHYPDFEIQLNTRNGFKVFAVECKYRSSWNQDGTIAWAKDRQVVNYANYSKEQQIPVFIILGVSGKSYSPDEVYIFSLDEIDYQPVIAYNKVQHFKRTNTKVKLFYDAEFNSLY